MRTLVNRIINAQPDCTLEQLLQMGMGFFSGDIALCKPPEEMMGLIAPMIESQLQFVTTAIPDQVVLVSTENSDSQGDPRIRLNGARLVMKWSPILPILFLVTLTALAVRSLPDWLKWWGYPFLAIGGISVSCRLDRLSHPGAGHSRGDTKPGRLPAAHFDLYPGGNGQRGIRDRY
ncbi:MAG: hypothetical protein M0C28_29395 [Candidatus Moduliflexus flocculans]|nr:hypothetical protein [Candidatus Moduliflexus flocculans]